MSPDNEAANSFRECVLIRHPRRDGEYAFAFITGQTVLQVRLGLQLILELCGVQGCVQLSCPWGSRVRLLASSLYGFLPGVVFQLAYSAAASPPLHVLSHCRRCCRHWRGRKYCTAAM